jgi:hypothetical protein
MIAKDTASATSTQPKATPKEPPEDWPLSRPSWWRRCLVLAALVLVIACIWFIFGMIATVTHYQTETKHTDFSGIHVGVQYPRLLYMDERDENSERKIVVSLTQTRTQSVDVVLIPKTDAVRILNEDGIEVSGRKTVTPTRDVAEPVAWYVAHANTSSTGAWYRYGSPSLFEVWIMPPGCTKAQHVPNLDFNIQVEGPLSKFLRDALVKLFVGALALATARLVPWWWERWQKNRGLEPRIARYLDAGKIDSGRDEFAIYKGLRHPWLFLDNANVEKRYGRAEARLWYDEALQALSSGELTDAQQYLEKARKWYSDDKEINDLCNLLKALDSSKPVDALAEQLEELGEESALHLRRLLDQGEREEDIRQALLKILADIYNTWLPTLLKEDLEDQTTPSERRIRIIRALKKLPYKGRTRFVERALREDRDLSVQIEAAWASSGEDRPDSVALRSAEATVIDEWLQALRHPPVESLEYNPFAATSAEKDDWLERHYIEHPGYWQLFGPFSIALFAASGDGKTSGRMMLKKSLDSRPDLVVEYTDFGPWIACLASVVLEIVKKGLMAEREELHSLSFRTASVSTEDHIREILKKIASALGVDPSSLIPQDMPAMEQLKRALGEMRKEGYETLYVLVDNLDGYAETQAYPWIGELLVRSLFGNFHLLDLPGITFRFFLPMAWKKRLLKYGGFTTDRIKAVDMVWNEELLGELLRVRLAQATHREAIRPIDTLMAFVDISSWPGELDLDQVLIGQAQNSVRDLIAFVNMLFQHRAQTWYESGRAPEELFIGMADWAVLLEHLLRRTG